jgi:hypothetical protein
MPKLPALTMLFFFRKSNHQARPRESPTRTPGHRIVERVTSRNGPLALPTAAEMHTGMDRAVPAAVSACRCSGRAPGTPGAGAAAAEGLGRLQERALLPRTLGADASPWTAEGRVRDWRQRAFARRTPSVQVSFTLHRQQLVHCYVGILLYVFIMFTFYFQTNPDCWCITNIHLFNSKSPSSTSIHTRPSVFVPLIPPAITLINLPRGQLTPCSLGLSATSQQ